MFEVLCTTTDEFGTRTGPTGEGSINEEKARRLADAMRRRYGEPGTRFFVEWVPSADEWNAY
jgi:hypothetical protein